MNHALAALDDHAFVSALLNVAIPAGEPGLPGAGELGLEADVTAGVRADKMLGPLVEAGAEAVREAALSRHPEGLPGMTPDEAAEVIEEQLAAHPLFMMGLLRYLYPAYYQQPQVLQAIGEPPRPPFPEGFEVEATDPALLEKLQARRRS